MTTTTYVLQYAYTQSKLDGQWDWGDHYEDFDLHEVEKQIPYVARGDYGGKPAIIRIAKRTCETETLREWKPEP